MVCVCYVYYIWVGYVLWTTKINFNKKYGQNYKNTSPTFINVYINKCTPEVMLYVDLEKKLVRIWKNKKLKKRE